MEKRKYIVRIEEQLDYFDPKLPKTLWYAGVWEYTFETDVVLEDLSKKDDKSMNNEIRVAFSNAYRSYINYVKTRINSIYWKTICKPTHRLQLRNEIENLLMYIRPKTSQDNKDGLIACVGIKPTSPDTDTKHFNYNDFGGVDNKDRYYAMFTDERTTDTYAYYGIMTDKKDFPNYYKTVSNNELLSKLIMPIVANLLLIMSIIHMSSKVTELNNIYYETKTECMEWINTYVDDRITAEMYFGLPRQTRRTFVYDILLNTYYAPEEFEAVNDEYDKLRKEYKDDSQNRVASIVIQTALILILIKPNINIITTLIRKLRVIHSHRKDEKKRYNNGR